MRLSTLGSVLATLAMVGCASTPSADPSADPSPGVAQGPAEGLVRWTGSLNPTTQRTGNLGGADQAKAFGNVLLVTSPNDPNRTDVRITVTVPSSANNSSLPWALLPGRCGSGSLPVTSPELFPPIEIGSNGRGELTSTLALTLPDNGSYHVNVYWRGNQLTDVMTCGNLRRG